MTIDGDSNVYGVMTPADRKRFMEWWTARDLPGMEISEEVRAEATRLIDDPIHTMHRLEYRIRFPSIPIKPAVDIVLPSFPWYTRGFVGRIGLTRLNPGLESLSMRAVNIITHMLGFWRDRQERRLLRVEFLDRKRKGRRLWT